MKCPHCGKNIDPSIGMYDEAIEHYYRARAAGAKVTIRKIADRYGFAHANLNKAKQRYDAAGKWGSKKKPLTV